MWNHTWLHHDNLTLHFYICSRGYPHLFKMALRMIHHKYSLKAGNLHDEQFTMHAMTEGIFQNMRIMTTELLIYSLLSYVCEWVLTSCVSSDVKLSACMFIRQETESNESVPKKNHPVLEILWISSQSQQYCVHPQFTHQPTHMLFFKHSSRLLGYVISSSSYTHLSNIAVFCFF